MSNSFEGKLIVLVDDDPDILSTVSDFLTLDGFRVKGFSGAQSFFEFLQNTRPDLIILDIVLPDMSGFQICKAIKDSKEYSDVPIIILSGQQKDTDKVFGLGLGADDYMIKPYSLDELLARVKAVLRRASSDESELRIDIGVDLLIDLKRYKVILDGGDIDLTVTEFKIFYLLCSHRGQIFSRERILDHLWGSEKIVVDRTVDVHIRHLREKLGDYSDIIEVVRGLGYRIKE